MNIIQLTPGTGNFYCGSCLRDNAMVKVMRENGHDAVMLPMYLPHVVDEEEASKSQPIFFGGINVFLEQKLSIFRHTPRWLDRMFNAKWLLRWAAGKSEMTEAKDLGEIAVSMIQGEQGKQVKQIEQLIDWIRDHFKPDVISLSNVMLLGLVKRIKQSLGCKVVCTMQGEDTYLDSLIEPYRSQCWKLLTERAVDVDAFISVSDYHRNIMKTRMSLPSEKVHTVLNGINLDGYEARVENPNPPVIGFLARMCYAKRLHSLVDAFIALKKRNTVPGLKLHVAGSMNNADLAYVNQQKEKLDQAGVMGDVVFMPNLSHEEKQAFLRGLSVLSVPATYGESFGLYVVEAWASGVPVVQPAHGAFPELISKTGGGLLYTADDLDAYVGALEELVLDQSEGVRLGAQAREVVMREFSVEHMTHQVINIMAGVCNSSEKMKEVG